MEGGRALRTAPSPPAIAAASLLCVSAADADVLPPKLMFSLPNAVLSASAATKPWSPSPALAATLARVPLKGRGAQKTPKPAGTLSEKLIVYLLLAKGFCPSGVGQVHLHAKGVGEDPAAWGHGVFWPLLLGTGAFASPACCLPVLALGYCSLG